MPFQLSYQQLVHPDHHGGDHHVELTLTKSEHTKLMRNIRNEKGYRFKSEHIHGGSLLRKLKKTFHKVVNVGKK